MFIDFMMLRKAPPRILLVVLWWANLAYLAIWFVGTCSTYLHECGFREWGLYEGIGTTAFYAALCGALTWFFLKLVERVLYGPEIQSNV